MGGFAGFGVGHLFAQCLQLLLAGAESGLAERRFGGEIAWSIAHEVILPRVRVRGERCGLVSGSDGCYEPVEQ